MFKNRRFSFSLLFKIFIKKMISYRLLNEKDTKEYRRLRLQCLKEYPYHFGSTYESESKRAKLFFEECLENGNPDTFIVGVFDKETCIGIGVFIRESSKKSKHRGAIIQMYVVQFYQGKGIGKEIVRQIFEKAFNEIGVELITLGVIESNIAGLKAYKQMGFKEYGRMKNYFKLENGYLDLIEMIKMNN